MKFSLIIFFFLLFQPLAAAAGDTLHFGSAADSPLSNSRQTGMADAIVREAFSRIGITVVIEQLPAERSLLNADSGINDGDLIRIGGLSRLYPNLLPVPEKIMDMEVVGFARNLSVRTDGWESLAPFSVGFVTGWKILEENIHSAVLTKVENRELLFKLLARGRAEIVIYERLGGYDAVVGMEIPGGRVLEPPLATRQMFLYLNKKHRLLVPRVVESLRGMKADGTYDRIVSSALGALMDRVKSWVK